MGCLMLFKFCETHFVDNRGEARHQIAAGLVSQRLETVSSAYLSERFLV